MKTRQAKAIRSGIHAAKAFYPRVTLIWPSGPRGLNRLLARAYDRTWAALERQSALDFDGTRNG